LLLRIDIGIRYRMGIIQGWRSWLTTVVGRQGIVARRVSWLERRLTVLR